MEFLLILKPKTKFFFGGDRTFDSKRQEYFSKSEYFPQQTALLGMLRYNILKFENKLEINWIGKSEIIGADFSVDGEFNLGVIKKLSPICICEEENIWIPAGNHIQKVNENVQVFTYNASKNLLEGYNHKNELQTLFYAFRNKRDKLNSHKNFYIEFPQVGNQKTKDGSSSDDTFFKNVFLGFKRNKDYQQEYSFCFWVETNDNYDMKFLNNQTVSLGRESDFLVEVKDKENIFTQIEQANEKSFSNPKIVLLSETYVKDLEKLRENAHFILTSNVFSFRYFNRASDGKHYSLGNRKSKNYNLLERGTVIFSKNISEIKKLLDNKNFKTIGYNYYEITE